MMSLRALLFSFSLLSLASFAQADVKKVWDNEPMTLHINVGSEIRVIFPTNINLQVPLSITNQLQTLAPNRHMIYWTALEPFEKSRIIATADDGQDVYIFDLVASPSGLSDNILIEDPRRVLQAKGDDALIEEVSDASEVTLNDPAEIVLTRFAAQTLYAPDRLIPSNPQITLLDTPELPSNFPLMQSSSGESFAVEVVASWLGYNRYITAVMLKNLGDRPVTVNPEKVRGNFTHITPNDLYLGEAGSWEDHTTLYLVSSKPFSAAVVEDGYAY